VAPIVSNFVDRDGGENLDMKVQRSLSRRIVSKIAWQYEWLTMHGLREGAILAPSRPRPSGGWLQDVAGGPGVILQRVLGLEARRCSVGLGAASGLESVPIDPVARGLCVLGCGKVPGS
jgi:hypothetical protein